MDSQRPDYQIFLTFDQKVKYDKEKYGQAGSFNKQGILWLNRLDNKSILLNKEVLIADGTATGTIYFVGTYTLGIRY